MESEETGWVNGALDALVGVSNNFVEALFENEEEQEETDWVTGALGALVGISNNFVEALTLEGEEVEAEEPVVETKRWSDLSSTADETYVEDFSFVFPEESGINVESESEDEDSVSSCWSSMKPKSHR